MSTATEAAAMRDAGASIEDIMIKFGWARTYAYNRIAQGRGGNQKEKRRAAYAARNREIADAALGGESYVELSKRYNMSVPSVARACHRCRFWLTGVFRISQKHRSGHGPILRIGPVVSPVCVQPRLRL